MGDLMAIELSEISIAELEALATRLDTEISSRREILEKEMHALAEREGLSDTYQIVRRGTGAKSRGRLQPKYRNPENPGQTWSGRGKKPAWVVAELGAGKSLEDLAI